MHITMSIDICERILEVMSDAAESYRIARMERNEAMSAMKVKEAHLTEVLGNFQRELGIGTFGSSE